MARSAVVTGTLALVEERRVVTVCCGGHRPAPDCLCCAECVTNGAPVDPAIRAVIAHDDRERVARLRQALRRAEHLEIIAQLADHTEMVAGLDDALRDLYSATSGAVAVLPPMYPHEQGVLS
jgi:hypothetical protein